MPQKLFLSFIKLNQAYTFIQTANNLDSIVMDGKKTGIYHLNINTTDKLLEVQNKLEDLVSETNKNLTNLEDMTVLNEYKDIQVNIVGSVKDYWDKLQEKYMFF
jgi:viroplasmin and RNaseH domain-containing protein